MLGWLAAVLAVLVGLFFYLGSGDAAPEAADTMGRTIYSVALGVMAILLAFSIAGDYRGRASKFFKHALIWIGLAAALVTGYVYRDQVTSIGQRVASEIVPPGQAVSINTTTQGERAVRLRKRPDGHFIARASAQGSALEFMVDTGASTVVLKSSDAALAGIDVNALSFTIAVDTANGTAFVAPIRLRTLAIGPIELEDVEAVVAKPGSLKENLLGMSFLKRLRSYEVSGDFLTLRG
jgi:aspartyl protease family protein